MTWASLALRTLICEKMWHRFVVSDKLQKEAHRLLLAPGLPLKKKHMYGLNRYVMGYRV
jgi:hypothetical protein